MFAIWPCVVIVAAVLALARLPVFAGIAPASGAAAGRVTTLDGLRGLLALAVFFHHGAIYYGFLRTGVWAVPPSRFYALLGPLGVSFFFMITGYLFWGRAIDARGRLDWVGLYVGRVARIAPAYAVMVALVLAIVAAQSGLVLRESPAALGRELLAWAALGYAPLPALNADPATGLVTAGVTWTLHYEWLFYANLLWLAVFARWRWTHLPFACAGLAACLLGATAGGFGGWAPAYDLIFAALFFSGMTCASVERSLGRLTLPPGVSSFAACGLLLVLFGCFDTAYAPLPVLLVGACFLLIASGGSLFGLLTSRGAQRLGSASFSIYLMQGLALAVVYAVPPVRRFALRGGLHNWATVALACTLLVAAAMLSYRFAERPGIAAGRLLRLRRRVATPPARPGSVSQPG